MYFHWIECNFSSNFCFTSISSVTIGNFATNPLTVGLCTKILRRLSSPQIRFDDSGGIAVLAGSGSCNSTGPYCSNSSECCLPSPAVSSLFSFLPITLASPRVMYSSLFSIPITYSISSLINPTTSESFHTSSLSIPSTSDITLISSPLPSSTSVPTHACHSQTNTTDRGQFEWPLTLAGMTATILCPNGPIGATASRICSTSSNWESPDVMMCATTDVTAGFIELSKVCNIMIVVRCIMFQVNITVDNFSIVSFNMSSLVEDATRTLADQNIKNIHVISTVLEAIVFVLLNNNSAPSIIEVSL